MGVAHVNYYTVLEVECRVSDWPGKYSTTKLTLQSSREESISGLYSLES